MHKSQKAFQTTTPFLPPLNDFCKALVEIWDNKWLTNNGPILQRYQQELKSYFKTDNICLFTNGSLALQIALQGLPIHGEVITTPFTFVATTNSLYWNKLHPIFCDIEPDHFTLDPERVEQLITPNTTAILAVHVFGYPCNLGALADLATRHNLCLIYDAAHAFGVQVNGVPISKYGDLSMFSLHATKLYHSMEGGLLAFKDSKLTATFNHLKNHGIKNETEVVMPGTNAKMSEMHAMMGSLMLKYVDQIIEKKRKIYHQYNDMLSSIPGILCSPKLTENIEYNYAFVPVQIEEKEFGISRDGLYTELKKYNIFTRRYFYPLVTNLSCYSEITVPTPLTVASKVAERILVLPSYFDLEESDVSYISDVIISIHRKNRKYLV